MAKKLASGTLIAALMLTLFLGEPASASAPPNTKEKAAIASYVNTMAQARIAYLATMRSSRKEVLNVGKAAEKIRRASVHSALFALTLVLIKAQAPSLAAERSYRKAIAKLKAHPGDATLRADVKASLHVLTQATAALKMDQNVAVARAVFNKARLAALDEFKSTVSRAIKARSETGVQAAEKFRATKAKAVSDLKASLKIAKTN